MKNDKIERSVKRAFVNAAPYQLDKVTEKCKEQKGKVIPSENKQAKKSINKTFARIAAAAAALVLMIIGGYAYGERYGVASTVALDVNPSIEIGVNKGEKVVYVTPKNEDGKKVIGDMKLEGSDIRVAVNALIGSMLREGYISEMANSILISVNGDDAKKNAAMQSALSAEVTDMLNTGSFQGAVLSQTITSDPETKRLAEEYGITEGKAQLIRQITENNAAHTFEELAGLSVNELNLIGESGTKSITNVTSAGTASERAYIGEAEAKRIALAHAGVNEGDIYDYEFEMDYEHGAMIYELEFDCAGCEYEYDINAKTGEIIKFEADRRGSVSPTAAPDAATAPASTPTPSSTPKPTANAESGYIGESKAKQIALAHADGRARRAARGDERSEGRHDQDDRRADAKTGQGQAADLRHVADVDAVYNIIEHIDELRDHRRDRQPEQESADRLRAEKRVFLIHPDAFFL